MTFSLDLKLGAADDVVKVLIDLASVRAGSSVGKTRDPLAAVGAGGTQGDRRPRRHSDLR